MLLTVTAAHASIKHRPRSQGVDLYIYISSRMEYSTDIYQVDDAASFVVVIASG